MKYVLINRSNIVVDILDEVRYIKLQSSSGISVACEEKEGIGVIGSDCNTHYVLIKADTANNPNAVSVLEFENIPSDVTLNLTVYDNETQSFITDLNKAKALKQEENKTKFADYLSSHPLTWTDGKNYGITQEDQSEISLNLNQYNMAISAGADTPRLEWHAQHEECVLWTVEELTALSVAISQKVYPIYHKMQRYKTSIYEASSIEDLKNIDIKYNEE